jgi:hypothetical protein
VRRPRARHVGIVRRGGPRIEPMMIMEDMTWR